MSTQDLTPEVLAALYARAFPASRPWTSAEIAALAAAPGFAVTAPTGFEPTGVAPTGFAPTGFALGRAVAGEAELVTMAVDPEARRQGLGRALLAGFEAEARARGADTAFLEVAEDNAPARALYAAAGWIETGRRKGYYASGSLRIDAITMGKPLD